MDDCLPPSLGALGGDSQDWATCGESCPHWSLVWYYCFEWAGIVQSVNWVTASCLTRVQFVIGAVIFLLLCPDWLWGHLYSSYPMATIGCFPRGKATAPPSSVEVKNARRFTCSAVLIYDMVLWHMDSFTFHYCFKGSIICRALFIWLELPRFSV